MQIQMLLTIAIDSAFNPLMGTLNPQSNEPSYNHTVIGTLAVGGWAVTAQSPLRCTEIITAHPSTASVPTIYYSTWHYSYKG